MKKIIFTFLITIALGVGIGAIVYNNNPTFKTGVDIILNINQGEDETTEKETEETTPDVNEENTNEENTEE